MKITRRSFQFGLVASGLTLPSIVAAQQAGLATTPGDVDLSLARVDPELRDGARAVMSRPLPSPLTDQAIRTIRAKNPPPPTPRAGGKAPCPAGPAP